MVIDAFRLINSQTLMLGQEPRQTTSNLGHLEKPSIQVPAHELNQKLQGNEGSQTHTQVLECGLTPVLACPEFSLP